MERGALHDPIVFKIVEDYTTRLSIATALRC